MFRENWRADLTAGFILFLIALPLSIGIAIASGAPPSAGIIAAVVGGIVGSIFTGSFVTINGPAAGLTVIVLASIQDLGNGDPMAGFRFTLAATVLAGGIQILFGLMNVGSLGLAFPSAAIHGLLTAIGAIIMAKQVHILLGVSPAAKSIFGLLAEIPTSLLNLSPLIAFIGLGSLILIVAHSFIKQKWLKKIPAPLIAAVFGVGVALLTDLEHPHKIHMLVWDFDADPKYLLNIPQNLASFLVLPDFSQIFSSASIRNTITIALVASLESVLSAYAVDRLDQQRRKSNLNRELVSKGVCNMVSGGLGGLPIIAEIVRSSANIANGAKTRWANFYHGGFILLFVAMFPKFLHEIPLAALAAILLVVGFRLAHPRNFVHMWKLGWDQFAVFTTTFLVCLATDILIGVSLGFVLEFTLNAWRAGKIGNLFRLQTNINHSDDVTSITIKSPAVFSNFLQLKKVLDRFIGKKNLEINLISARLIDHTVMEHLHRYEEEHRETSYGFDIKLSRMHRNLTEHPLSGKYRRKPAVKNVFSSQVKILKNDTSNQNKV